MFYERGRVVGMEQKAAAKGDENEQLATLLHNARAVQAVAAAVEGTLGPKGLDTLLVDEGGNVVVTNDGVTILEKMEVRHPVARMVVRIAQSQQAEMGDGTTTATVLAAALVTEGTRQVQRGVPVARVIAGMRRGIAEALRLLGERAVPVRGLDDPALLRIAYIAGREQADIAELVVEGARRVGEAKLRDPDFKLADTVVAHERAENEVVAGVLIGKQRASRQMPQRVTDARVLIVDDALAPESLDEEALATEAGFRRYLELKEAFVRNLEKLVRLGVRFVAVDRSLDPAAEEFFADHGILAVHRVARAELRRLAAHTGAVPIKRTGLKKREEDLARYLGTARCVEEDPRLGRVRVTGGGGEETATILVGASTREVTGERERIARDAASAVQAAVRGGYLPGGGSVEVAVARELERLRATMRGMEGFGVDVVATALRVPLARIVQNAGFNPLEKLEAVTAAQVESGSDALGVDCDTGDVVDMVAAGVLDPAPVKRHALKTAGEVAEAILRIHTVIRMRRDEEGEG